MNTYIEITPSEFDNSSNMNPTEPERRSTTKEDNVTGEDIL